MPELRKLVPAYALSLAFLALLLSGCGHKSAEEKTAPSEPSVRVVKPVLQTIDLAIEQPGFVNAFQETPLFAKESGFIKDYYVDIGDEVKKDQLLAEIFVPELNEQYDQTLKLVVLDEKLVNVAEKSVQNAKAEVAEAQANVGRYEADIERWQEEVKRLTAAVQEKVVDKEMLLETEKTLAASIAAKKAADAGVAAREADQAMAEASLEKAHIQVEVAKTEVAKAKALLDYTHITAPYDGVVTVRHANIGDYVQAAGSNVEVASSNSNANPSAIFVVEKTDILRVFCYVDESHAAYVQPGAKATIRARGLSGVEIPGTVTRTSWSIRAANRSLLTEVDLTKKQYDGLRPGRYCTVTIYVDRPNVFALPRQAVKEEGGTMYCYLVRNGKVEKTPVETGLSNSDWVEVDQLKIDDPWVKVNGDEKVILGDTADLGNGEAVRTAQ